MDYPVAQLAALVAIADHGSFEAAARSLHVTTSAISQRIRALENAAGRVLVSRGVPCLPTEAGVDLVRLGRQISLLYAEQPGSQGPTELTVAVNADSLATWFRPVLTAVADWDGVGLRLQIEDESHTHDLLRRGTVMGAITSDASPPQGCSVTPLGLQRYRPVAAPSLVKRTEGDWARMPMVVFNDKDLLQHTELRRHTRAVAPVIHQIPSSADFRAAVAAGLGWGLLPEHQAAPDIASGTVVPLCDHTSKVPLFWQRWKVRSVALDRFSEVLRQHAPPG